MITPILCLSYIVLLINFPLATFSSHSHENNASHVECANKKDGIANGMYDVRPNLFIDRDNLLGKSQKSHKKEFAYGGGPFGPSHWPKIFPKCGGKHQSPVNIDLQSLKISALPELKWTNYDQLPDKMSLTNTHNTLQLDAGYKKPKIPFIQGGPLQKPYAFKSLHFHWSNSEHKGSEHTINKKSYPMEMHVVHYRSDLNFSNAVQQDKGLCVVAYIFEINDDKCNDAITTMFTGSDTTLNEHEVPFELNNLFRLDSLVDKITTDYVTYSGSLTTPPCYESVIWIVSPYTLAIAKKQIEKFRSVSTGANGFGDNFRPVQPLNERLVAFVKSEKHQ